MSFRNGKYSGHTEFLTFAFGGKADVISAKLKNEIFRAQSINIRQIVKGHALIFGEENRDIAIIRHNVQIFKIIGKIGNIKPVDPELKIINDVKARPEAWRCKDKCISPASAD